jgi:hypothetical protein
MAITACPALFRRYPTEKRRAAKTPPMPRPPAGLCDACRHQRLVGNTRGSTFSLCERSRVDGRYPRYPRLPVASCAGFERREGSDRG